MTVSHLKEEFSGPTRIVWIAALGIIFTVGILETYGRWRSHGKIVEDERNKLAYQTRLVEERVSGLIRGFMVAIEQIAGQPGGKNPLCDQELVDQYKSFYPQAHSFSVVDGEGIIRCSSNRALIGLNRSAAEYFKAAKAGASPGKLVISSPRQTYTGVPVVTMFKAVAHASGRLQKVVVANLDARSFDALLDSLVTEGQSAFIAHQNGMVVSRVPEPDKYRYSNLLNGPSFLKLHLAQNRRLSHQRAVGVLDKTDRFSAISSAVPEEMTLSSALFVGVTEKAERVFSDWRTDSLVYGAAWIIASAMILGMTGLISRRQRELIRARDKALAADKAKNQFLSSMSHELRTPLNAILGFSQLTELATREPETRQNVAQITTAGWHLLDLINDVLDLATIEAGQMKFSVEPIDLKELAQECIALAQPLAERRGMTLRLDLCDSCSGHCFVQADRTRLKQSILNYLSNSAKYGRQNSGIRLSMSRAGGKVRIEVADEGEGIPREKLIELFQPFNRLGMETGRIQGAGLGLALTREMVELMGGRAGAESESGKGSVFWIELEACGAVASPRLQQRESEPAVATGEASVRVLLVEDNPANAEFVTMLFGRRRPDMEITLATDGKMGLELACKLNPDVLLLDIHLPGIDGVELLRRLRAAGIGAPAIALTAAAMPEDIARGKAAGFAEYVTKPVNAGRLMEIIDKVIDSAKREGA